MVHPSPVIARRDEEDGPPKSRHCEEQRGQVRGATKQSPNAISNVIFAEIMLGDCFGPAPR
jgi:hypothetical protein